MVGLFFGVILLNEVWKMDDVERLRCDEFIVHIKKGKIQRY